MARKLLGVTPRAVATYRRLVGVSGVGFIVLLGLLACSGWLFAQTGQAQEQGRRGPGQGAVAQGSQAAVESPRASMGPAFFKVEWVRPASQTAPVPVVQENIADPNVQINYYGAAAKQLLTSGTPGSDTTPFTVWSGECAGPFAITFKQKDNYVDLSKLGKMKWTIKTSGFHEVRPVVKLADGTMLVGDHTDSSVAMLVEREVALAGVRWIKLDPTKIVTLNSGNVPGAAPNEIWVPNPGLSKVDEIGFVDLMPGSGHGTGGYIHLGTIEVFGKPVPRNAATSSR